MNTSRALLIASLICCCAVGHCEVVAVVALDSPIKSLNNAQLADVFLGRPARLPNGVVAMPIDQSEGSPVRDEFYLKMTGKSPAELKAFWSKLIFTGRGRPPKSVRGSTEVLKVVREDRTAIGYVERAAADATVRIIP